MPPIAVYVSSHGFGHAVRVGDVLRALLERHPSLDAHLRTVAPDWLFPFAEGRRFIHRVATDVGMAQRHGLAIDFEATLAKLADLEASWEQRVSVEAAWLREIGAGLVLGDIPPLGFDAAERAAVPSVALGNFSWDWIYGTYARHDRRFAQHAERAAACYHKARYVLRLPFHAEMAEFGSIVDLPLVARRARCSRSEARERLGLPPERPVVLLSFGGFGFDAIRVERFAEMSEILFLATERFGNPPPNLVHLDRPVIDYSVVLRASDAVITKPGYGIVAGSLANGVRVLFAARSEFPEAPILVRALEEHATARLVGLEDLERGEIRQPLESLLARPVAETTLPVDGAERAAEILGRELGT